MKRRAEGRSEASPRLFWVCVDEWSSGRARVVGAWVNTVNRRWSSAQVSRCFSGVIRSPSLVRFGEQRRLPVPDELGARKAMARCESTRRGTWIDETR